MPALNPHPQVRFGKTRGLIESIDHAGGRIVIKAMDGSHPAFTVTPTTHITRNEKRATLQELQAGDRADVVRFERSTRNLDRLVVRSK